MNSPKLLAVAVLITAAIIGAIVYSSRPKNLIERVEPSLDPASLNVFQDQLRSAEQRVNDLPDSTSEEEKATSYALLARAYYNLGEYKEAREWFEKAVKTKKNIPVYLEYYNLLTAMQDFEGARDIARDGLEIYPFQIDIWKSLIALSRTKLEANDTEIISLYLEALAKSESHPDILADFARYQEELGRPEEALKYWRAALLKSPNTAFYQEQVNRLEARLQ